MTTGTVMPRETAEWTVDDLERLPDDGLQYELLDGILLVSPAPVVRHQVVAANLFTVVRASCPHDMLALFAPLDWQPNRAPRSSRTYSSPAGSTSRNEA